MVDDDFEWDEAKAAANIRKHKISFQEACRVFDDLFVLIEQDLNEDFGEDRYIATGIVEGLLLTVIYTERGVRIRIISARKADSNDYRSQAPS